MSFIIEQPKMLQAPQREYLRALGLTSDAIDIYQVLLQHGVMTPKQIATCIGSKVNALYRLLYALDEHGLVRRNVTKPVTFDPVPVERAFPVALQLQRTKLQDMLSLCGLSDTSGSDNGVRMLYGRQALYDEYMRQVAHASTSVDIFSIGIAYSKKLAISQEQLVKKGIRIRHLVQELKWKNRQILQAWLQLGIEVRLSRSQRGFHLVIVDGSTAIISFSDPLDTDNRLSIITSHDSVICLYRTYFEDMWLHSSQIDQLVKP